MDNAKKQAGQAMERAGEAMKEPGKNEGERRKSRRAVKTDENLFRVSVRFCCTLTGAIRLQMSTRSSSRFQYRHLLCRKRRLKQSLPLLISPEEIRDEMHAILEVRPILRTAVP